MNSFKRLIFALFAVVLAVFAVGFHPTVVRAQEGEPVACDSTLAVLLLVAEHDYDYLSHMEMMPNVDLGQYHNLITGIVAMMQAMEMSDEEIAEMEAMQAHMDEMMMMSSADMLHEYDMMSGMETMEGMTMLAPGNVAGENELCATLRADVERFLTARILADMEMSMMEGQ